MRQNVLLRRRVTPQRVRLPNGTSFLARHERVSRKNLTLKRDDKTDKDNWTEKQTNKKEKSKFCTINNTKSS